MAATDVVTATVVVTATDVSLPYDLGWLEKTFFSIYRVCGSRHSRRFGRRATHVKTGNAGPKLHWSLWGESGFSALPFDWGYAPKNDTPI